MGTRGLIGFIIKGVRKAAYNNNDSYPSGLGNDIVRFISSLTEEEIIDMQAKVEAIEWIDSDSEDTPIHNHDLLERIQAGQTQVVDSSDFANDGVFCEYAYYVDFENRRVEVDGGWYTGRALWTFEGLAIDCFEYVDQRPKEDGDRL